ncbi:MAG: hypothetical protein LBF95_07810 [Treponema sp.]|jgi:hypothetical protein|nr:hypothetical protein [Treponema sp.]
MRIEAAGKPQGCKLIRVSAEIRDDRIVYISIRGDFFACPEERFDAVEEALVGTPVSTLAESFDSLITLNNMETFGISGAGLAEVFNEALTAGAQGAGH